MWNDHTFIFFFSSRRRHTRCSRDWSSDVCSSDLTTRSSTRVTAARSPWTRRSPTPGSRSRSWTRGWGSPPRSRGGSSRSSTVWGGAKLRGRGAVAWAWRSSSTWPKRMAAGSRSRAGRGRGAVSPCGSPWRAVARILIADDEPEIVRGLEDNLRFEGDQTVAATNGEDALTLALSDAPDLVLLDVMMPRMSGWDVCRELRRRGVDVPVIMLTARGAEVDRVLGLELGADDYVTKPFSLR